MLSARSLCCPHDRLRRNAAPQRKGKNILFTVNFTGTFIVSNITLPSLGAELSLHQPIQQIVSTFLLTILRHKEFIFLDGLITQVELSNWLQAPRPRMCTIESKEIDLPSLSCARIFDMKLSFSVESVKYIFTSSHLEISQITEGLAAFSGFLDCHRSSPTAQS